MNKTIALCAIVGALAAQPQYAEAAKNVYLPPSSECYIAEDMTDKDLINKRYRQWKVSKISFKVKNSVDIENYSFAEQKKVEKSGKFISHRKFITYSSNGKNVDAFLNIHTYGIGEIEFKREQMGFLNALSPTCQQNYDKLKGKVEFEYKK